jgi:hypothetical protein
VSRAQIEPGNNRENYQSRENRAKKIANRAKVAKGG